jgi:hypothetical protein
MATFIVLLMLGLLTIAITPVIASVNHYKVPHTDLMAGDEGED